ncbi:MAG: exodeoxyribonuclease V subunit gamma [Chlamydiales bacterium]|nr:exodeoxyribonuclease V subunit gamma [Chlamydiales bacterium]
MKNAGELNSQIILSNKLEELADALKERLFFSGGHPFDRRVVIVPSLNIKRFLMMRYADDPDLQIAAGIEIYTLSQAMGELFEKDERRRVPTLLELSFQIEEEIWKLKSVQDEDEKALLSPLFSYVADEENIAPLSEELALLFLRYGRQERAFLDDWLGQEGWQQSLWRRIFNPTSRWIPLSQLVESTSPAPFPLYIFHFSALPRLFLNFFGRCNSIYFLLSPSPLFWGDLCSDKERAYLRKLLERRGAKEAQKSNLEALLGDQNSFFANLSKVGRDFFNELLDANLLEEERYVEPSNESTLLERIQGDVFEMRSPEGEIFSKDNSIELRGSSSRWKEVGALYEALLEVLDRHAADKAPIYAKDILVLAPDITLYLPYIQTIFGASESRLKFTVHDLPRSRESQLVQGLHALIALSTQRFDVNAALNLFSDPSFQKKFGLVSEDLTLFKRWAEKANILWGADADQRSHFLHETSEEGSWEAGFKRLLLGLAMVAPEDEELLSSTFPLSIVDKTEMEKLGLLIRIIRSLKIDLDPILKGEKRPISAWLTYLEHLAQSYLEFEKEERGVFGEIGKLSFSCIELESPVSFQRVIKALEKQLFQVRSSSLASAGLNAIYFGNLQEGAALPARIICMLGMEEGAFPRMEESRSLCALSTHALGKKLPKRNEEDRYLFLQLVLSARDYLLISYQKISAQDGKPLLPSPLVQELVSYIKRGYGSEITSELTQVYPPQKEARPFLSYSTPSATTSSGSFQVDIADLKKLAKNPLQFYFQKSLGLSLNWEEEEREFSLSALENALIKKRALHQPLSSILKSAEAKGSLPFAHYKELTRIKLAEEIGEMDHFFEKEGLSGDELIEVEWKEGCKQKEELSSGKWILPPLVIPLEEGSEATLVGKLSGVCKRGLALHAEKGFEGLIKSWPEVLMSMQIPLFEAKTETSLFLLKDKKRVDIRIADPLNSLKEYLKYYQIALHAPSPLFSEWAEPLIHGSEQDLEKKMTASKNSRDPYITWLFARDPSLSAAQIFENWSPLLRNLFDEVPT